MLRPLNLQPTGELEFERATPRLCAQRRQKETVSVTPPRLGAAAGCARPDLDRDVRVVPRQDDVPPLLPPLNQRHRESKDLAEEDQAAARPIHLTLGRDLDDGD